MAGPIKYQCPFCGGEAFVKSGHWRCVQVDRINRKAPMQIVQISGPLWKAEASSAGKWYEIDLDRPFCTCPAMVIQPNTLRKNGKTAEADAYLCKHIKAILNKTGQIVGTPTMDDEEKSKVAAKKAAILAKFEEREPSIQEKALRGMAELKAKRSK